MRRMRFLIPILILVLIFMAGLSLTEPSQAQNNSTWLPFDSESQPSEPSLVLIGANPAEINLSATLPGAYVDSIPAEGTVYTQLSASGYGHPAKYGLPDLPVLRQEVEIPFGARVSIEITSAQYADHSLTDLGLHPIYPMQLPVPKVDGVEHNQPFTINTKFYANGSLYPYSVVTISEPYIIRGHRILSVEVWPVAFDPSQASLRLYSQVNFRLILSGSDMAQTSSLADRYASPAFDQFLSQSVLNYNQGQPIKMNEPVGFLIISADAYAAALQPLVQLRQSRGFEVTLTPTSAIPGGATAANIKAYIQEAYNTWPVKPSYVLLVGDTDTVPTWTGPIISTSTDLYYATMDGSGDWHPDIGRGRFPVRSAAQTTYMVDKYLFYADLTGQEPWLKTASFPATCDQYQVAEGTHNYVIDKWTAPGGWTGTFPTNPTAGGDKLYCVTYDAGHQNLIDQFNLGRWAIIYSGHGSYSGWEMDFTPTDINNLTAYGMFPFVASHACLSGDFGMPEVFGETWVLQQNKGAIAYWGSSTYSYWGEDDVLERAAFDELFVPVSPHADITEMTYAGLAGVESAYPGSARYYWETYNILGDPTFHLFMEPDTPGFTLDLDPAYHEVCTEGMVTSTVEIGSMLNYSSTVYLENGDLPFNVTAEFDPSQAPAPYTSTLTVNASAGALEGDYAIVITATDLLTQTIDTSLDMRINTQLPSEPELLIPPNGSVNQPFTPSFDWSDVPLASSYNFELAKSPLFEEPIFTPGDLPTSSYIAPQPLEGGSCYWWRAQANNACGSGNWTEPFYFSTVNLGVSFFDDMESGSSKWSHAASQGVDHWVISTDQAHSPTHAWFVPDDGVVTDSRLWTTDPIAVGENSTLTFWHRYEFEEPGYDGGVLEISTNHGGTWSDLGSNITYNGYTGVINTCCGNPLGGREAWVDAASEWTQVEVDLSSFAGQQVMIRWRIGSDSSYGAQGWYIDDVQITTPLPPNPSPNLISITPDTGYVYEPTPVVINGTNFIGEPALQLGDAWLESVVMVSPETITAVVPAGLPAGVYDLTIYNGDCQPYTLVDAFTVLEVDEPISGLAATSDSPTYLGYTTTLTATIETGTNVTFTWDFGDDTTGSGAAVTHQYTAAGVYTATVTATNPTNDQSASTEVTVLVPPRVIHHFYLPVTFK